LSYHFAHHRFAKNKVIGDKETELVSDKSLKACYVKNRKAIAVDKENGPAPIARTNLNEADNFNFSIGASS